MDAKGKRETQLFDWMLINVRLNWWKFITLYEMKLTQIGREADWSECSLFGRERCSAQFEIFTLCVILQ